MVKRGSNRKIRYVQLSKNSKGKAILRSVGLKTLSVISIASFVFAFIFSIARFTGYAVTDNIFPVFSIVGVFLFLLGLTTLILYFKLK